MEILDIEAVVDENGAYRTNMSSCDHRESSEKSGEKRVLWKREGSEGDYGDKERGREGGGGGGDGEEGEGDGEEEGEGCMKRREEGGHPNAPDIPLFFSFFSLRIFNNKIIK